MKLTEEQYNRLKKVEKHLQRAVQNYCYGLFKQDYDIMISVYREIGGKKNLSYSCSTCCLVLAKELAKLYYEWTPDQNPLPKEVVEAVLEEKIEETEEEKPVKKPKKKSSRKKKTNE